MSSAFDTRFRVGFVGAGAVSEYHARAVRRVHGAAIVAVADVDEARGKAFATRWGIGTVGRTLEDIGAERLDVVHVLTPPETHSELALAALAHGCHVYVEKPFATSVEDCDRVAAAAAQAGRSVAVGHSLLRDPSFQRATMLVARGTIGDVVTVDYVRSQPAPPHAGGALPRYARDGGFPFRDVGVHGLYLAEALLGEIDEVHAQIASSGRDPLVYCDDWRISARCRRGTAHLHFSWTLQPWQSLLVVGGTRGVIRADLLGMTVTARQARRWPEPVTRVANALSESRQLAFQSLAAVGRVGAGRLRQFHGLQDLVVEFYSDLAAGREPAVTPTRARTIVGWTETVARQGDAQKAAFVARFTRSPQAPVLVTGAGGFLGRHVVARLLADDRRVRVLVRREPPREWWDNPRLDIMLGDLGDPDAVDRAVAGAELVFHLGATTRGARHDFDRGSITGTRNVVGSAVRHQVARFVYISSLTVLRAAGAAEGGLLTESSPLEPRPEERGDYTRAKVAAEHIVADAVRTAGLPAIILRPGEIIGGRAPLLTSGVAHRTGRTLVVLGSGELHVPVVAIDDLVEAIVRAGERGPFDGTVVHLVDPMPVTQNSLVAAYVESTGSRLRVIHVPRGVVGIGALVADAACRVLGRRAPLSPYRLASALSSRRFAGERARAVLGWIPRAGVQAALPCLRRARGETPRGRQEASS